MHVPFIFERIKLKPKAPKAPTTIHGDECYFCNKRIKEEKGYYSFHRRWDDDTDDKRFACHRDKCREKFFLHRNEYGYKNIHFNSEFSDGLGLYF